MHPYAATWRLMLQEFTPEQAIDRSDSGPRLVHRAPSADNELLPEIPDTQPAPMLACLGAGATLGLIVTRLATRNADALLVGALAGAAAAGLTYAVSICVIACRARECGPSEFRV